MQTSSKFDINTFEVIEENYNHNKLPTGFASLIFLSIRERSE